MSDEEIKPEGFPEETEPVEETEEEVVVPKSENDGEPIPETDEDEDEEDDNVPSGEEDL
jgi:hypothetical protein